MVATIERNDVTPEKAIEKQLAARSFDFAVEVEYDIDRQLRYVFGIKDGECWREEFSNRDWYRNGVGRPYEFADDVLDKLENSQVLRLPCCNWPIGIIRNDLEVVAETFAESVNAKLGSDFKCWVEVEYDRNRRSAVGMVSVCPDMEMHEFVPRDREWLWPQQCFEVAAGETTLLAVSAAVDRALKDTIPFFEDHAQKCRASDQWPKIKLLIAIKQGK